GWPGAARRSSDAPNNPYEEALMSVYAYVRSPINDPKLITRQCQAIQRWCDDRGWTLTRTFYDITSGLTPVDERPGTTALFTILAEGDMVVVTNYDRLARKSDELAQLLIDLQKRGVRVQVAIADDAS